MISAHTLYRLVWEIITRSSTNGKYSLTWAANMPNNKNCQVTANNLQSNAVINVLWGHVCLFFIFLSFLVTFTIRHLPSSCIYYSFHLSGLLTRWKISCPTYLYRNSFEIELDFYYHQVSFWACWDVKSFHDTVVCIWCSRRVSLFFVSNLCEIIDRSRRTPEPGCHGVITGTVNIPGHH